MIRTATYDDLPRAREIYAIARAAMRAEGNMTQWKPGDGPEERIEGDIPLQQLYVMEDEGGIYGVFAFIIGDDPTYDYIEGAWRSDTPYGTIHRIASDRTHRGVLGECIAWAKQKIGHIRIDTHEDNRTMRAAVVKQGFVPCGTIYVSDGTPRIAFDLL
jgi:hypothetical protein